MDSSIASHVSYPCPREDCRRSSLPYHHHHRYHHHLHVSPHCAFHSYMLHFNSHSPICPIFNLRPLSQTPPPDTQNTLPFQSEDAVSGILTMQEQNVEMGAGEEEEEEEDEEPVFVLTDEWREFFAKSEAKRRQEKKQARRKGKK